ncbi:MAG TPA: hypothetical protein VEA79_11165 [Phenylobacterium sp.]|nr:hypothetical protein [Phenylobacterium sp.]
MIAPVRTRGHRQRVASGLYRENAANASALAGAATLDRVRERHEHAAAAWSSLAILHEKSLLARQAPASPAAPGHGPDPETPERS